MFFLHSFLNILIFLLKFLDFLVGFPQLLLVQSQMHFLVSFHLLMLTAGSIQFEFQVSILDHKVIALIFKILQLQRIMFLPLEQILQLFLQPDLHLSGILSVLIKNLLKMTNNIFLRKVVNSVSFVHVEGVDVGGPFYSVLPLPLSKRSTSHQQFILRNRILSPISLQHPFKSIHTLLLDFVAGQLHKQQILVFALLQLSSEVIDIS